LGITQYSGKESEENGLVWDNTTKNWTFYPNKNYFSTPNTNFVLPHSNGYFSEFNTNNFSEFWTNAGASTRDSSLAFIDFTLTVNQSSNGNILNWTKPFVPITSYDVYEIKNNEDIFLGNTASLTFTHNTNQVKTCYYVVAKNNLDKGSSNQVCIINPYPQNTVISPSPVNAGALVNVYTNDNIEFIGVYNSIGQLISKTNSLNFQAPLSKGIYFVKVKTTNGIVSKHKLLVN
jgi:hypothetical protein